VDMVWRVDWHFWLASEPRLEYLVVEVDGRGTGYMGRGMRSGVRGQLGVLEAEDQAAAAEYALRPESPDIEFGRGRSMLIPNELPCGDGRMAGS
jgi:Prolyl oligopeptidase family